MRTVLYDVTFVPNRTTNSLHLHPSERFVACVKAVEDTDTFSAYHYVGGKHLVPDYKAIRDALPYHHRKAFDRVSNWWFPATLHSSLTGEADRLNACSAQLIDSKGRLIGSLYAAPYLFD